MKMIRDVMTPTVHVIEPSATLEVAATKMGVLDVGALPVFDGEVLVGMLTDRDIVVRASARGMDVTTARVADVMTPEVVFGFADQSLKEAAEMLAEKHVRRLVVLDRRGRLAGILSLDDIAADSGEARLTGETLERVMHKPVTADIGYHHILVALDGSPLAEQILPYVEPLARAFRARVTLVRAISPFERGGLHEVAAGIGSAGTHPDTLVAIESETRRRAGEYLARIRGELEGRGFAVDCEYAEGIPAADVIVERARRLGADLIAMTTHGRSGVERALFGSVAEAVLRSAPCPVLVVHPDGRK